LLLLDEPRPRAGHRARSSAPSRACATGVTILLVEQNARAALEVADHGYVLEMGEIALEGAARDLAVDPRVIDTYLGAARAKP
jgi:ABC-type branched-subunit amino acid transport system ATPase component